jgi:hypothetical protein
LTEANVPAVPPTAVDEELAKEVKEVTEVVRALNPSLTSIQRGISRVVTPYFVITIVLFLSVFDTGFPGFTNLQTLHYGGYVNSQGEYVGGLRLENVRSVSLALLTLLLFYMFIRFGFLYYQGIRLIVRLQTYFGVNLKPLGKEQVASLLRQVCKENYLIQAFVTIRKDATLIGLDGTKLYVAVSQFLSFLLIAIFVYFLGLSQYLMLIFVGSLSPLFAIVVGFVFLVYYGLFVFGIISDSTGSVSVVNSPYQPWYIGAFLFLVVMNVIGIYLGSSTGISVGYEKLVTQKVGFESLWGYYRYPLQF